MIQSSGGESDSLPGPVRTAHQGDALVRQLLFASLLALICATVALSGATPAAAEPVLAPVPGPLGRDTGRVQGEGVLTIKILPKSPDEPVMTLGHSIRVQLTAAAIPAQVLGHPYELFVAVTPLTSDGAADLTQLYARCGTVNSAETAPIPAEAISVSQSKTLKGKEAATIYSVALTEDVAVGVLDIPMLLKAAGLGTEGTLELPATTFSVSLEKDKTLRFYAESPSKTESLAIMVEVSEWEYIAAPGA